MHRIYSSVHMEEVLLKTLEEWRLAKKIVVTDIRVEMTVAVTGELNMLLNPPACGFSRSLPHHCNHWPRKHI